MCVLLNDRWQRQVCENCFDLGTHGALDKWRKSVKSMPHSLVYIGFDRHPSQMTQHWFKRVKNELYCHVWFKTKHAETAKHRDVENGQNRWYLHTPMVPYGLGCHYLVKSCETHDKCLLTANAASPPYTCRSPYAEKETSLPWWDSASFDFYQKDLF